MLIITHEQDAILYFSNATNWYFCILYNEWSFVYLNKHVYWLRSCDIREFSWFCHHAKQILPAAPFTLRRVWMKVALDCVEPKNCSQMRWFMDQWTGHPRDGPTGLRSEEKGVYWALQSFFSIMYTVNNVLCCEHKWTGLEPLDFWFTVTTIQRLTPEAMTSCHWQQAPKNNCEWRVMPQKQDASLKSEVCLRRQPPI